MTRLQPPRYHSSPHGMEQFPFHLRPAKAADLRQIANVQFKAVRANASAAYPPDLLWHWSTACDDPAGLAPMRAALAFGQERIIVAEVETQLCGFGAVSPTAAAIYAVYVAPPYGRRGIGSAILRRLEAIASEGGVSRLRVEASLNAEPFYQFNGYRVDSRGIFHLRKDVDMACVRMSKDLVPPKAASVDSDTRRDSSPLHTTPRKSGQGRP